MPGSGCEMPPVHPQRLGQTCLQYSDRFKDNAISSVRQATINLLQAADSNNRNSLSPKNQEDRKQNTKKKALGFLKNTAAIFAQKTITQETNAYLSNPQQY